MGIALSLKDYLDDHGLSYDVMVHQRTARCASTAQAAGISQDSMAKGVLVRYSNGYILAIVPASRDVAMKELGALYERPVGLASEMEVASVFRDCDVGAIPPVGEVYGVQTVIDDRLEDYKDIYFEGGDHRTLVHMNGRDFRQLMAGVPHADISVRKC